MRNGGTATMVGEFPKVDIEKQREDAGGGEPEDVSVGQSEKVIEVVVLDCDNKGESQLEGDSNSHDECRVCQDEKEEALISLGCLCRGGLAKAHQSCIVKWFNTRGSNKCEICQQVAAGAVSPYPQTSYCVWTREHDRRRTCFNPLWVAFTILISGLLLDVLISITLGVSAIPINTIIGIIVVLGLGTALRLGLEFCQERNVRRVVQSVEANASHVTIGYHPAL